MPTTGVKFKDFPHLSFSATGAILMQVPAPNARLGDAPPIFLTPVPGSVFYPAASQAQARQGTSTTSLLTPQAMAAVTNGINNQLDNSWGDWSGTVYSGTTHGAALPNLVGGDAPVMGLITGDIRTATIDENNIAFFYNNATHTPPVPAGDTLQSGIVAVLNGPQRIALVAYTDSSPTMFLLNLATQAWEKILPTDESVVVHDALGLRISVDWHLLDADAREANIVNVRLPRLIRREATRLVTYTPTYSNTGGNNPRWGVWRHERPYASPASNVTLAQIVFLLSNATGDDRLSFTALRDRPDSLSGGVPAEDSIVTSMIRARQVTGAKVALATLGLNLIDITGAANGQVPKVVNGVLTWANESAVDQLGPNSIGPTELKPHGVALANIDTSAGAAGQFLNVDSTSDANWSYLQASDVRSGQFAPARLAANGSANAILQYVNATTARWVSLSGSVLPANGTAGQLLRKTATGEEWWTFAQPANSVDTASLVNDAVTASKVGPNAINNDNVVNAALRVAKFSAVGSTNGQVIGNVNGVMTHRDLSIWEKIGSAVTIAAGTNTITLDTGRQFSDYLEIIVRGSVTTDSATIPVAVWTDTDSTNRWGVAVAGGGRGGIYHISDTQYAYNVETTGSALSNHGVHSVWGRR